MNVLSLFDGMSCGQIALERAGFKVDNYYASEVEEAPILVTKHNYPNTIHIGDVRKIDYIDGVLHTELGDYNVGKIDLLIGGSPCQNFSFIGSQKGMVTVENLEIKTLYQYLDLKDKGFEFQGQSYLFWEYVRLHRQINPEFFLLENVRMSKKWRDVFDNVMGVPALFINSKLVSAQSRPRLYWTNIPGVTLPIDKGVLLKNVVETQNRAWRPVGKWVFSKWGSDIKLKKLKKISCEKSSCLTTSKTHSDNYYLNEDSTEYTNLTSIEAEILQTVPRGYTSSAPEGKAFKMLGNGWTVDVIAHILSHINGLNEFF